MNVNRGLGLSGSFTDISLLDDHHQGDGQPHSAKNSSERPQTLDGGLGGAGRTGQNQPRRSSSFSSISSLASKSWSSDGSTKPLLRKAKRDSSNSSLSTGRGRQSNNEPSKIDPCTSLDSLLSDLPSNLPIYPEPGKNRKSPSFSNESNKSDVHKRRNRKELGSNDKEPKPKEDDKPRKHKHKSKNGSGKLRQQVEEQIPNYCCIPMAESSDSDSSDEEESNVNKKVAGLFFLGMLAGVGSTLAFFRYGGAAATAVSGFASISHSVNTDSTVKGSDNKVIGAGGSGLVNVNRIVKGSGNLGAEAADALAYPGMSEALKSECMKKGLTYVDPATGEWIGFSSTSGTGKCLLNIDPELIRGKCIQEKNIAELRELREKTQFEYERQRLKNLHTLMMAEDERAFELARADSSLMNDYAEQYINQKVKFNSVNQRRARSLNDEQKPSTSNAPQTIDAQTQELLDEMRGATANQEDRTQGLNWLKKANKRK